MSGRYWDAPLRWNASAERAGLRARVFCATMADLFESNAPAGQLDRLWSLIARTAHLDWQLLTKRPERILTSLPTDWDTGYRNVWLGTTVEDHRVAGRIEIIRDIPAVVRFLSLEPLIGPISNLDLRGIHWVIVGGESGPNARPIRREWVSEILAQCSEQNVAFFFHQWGGVNKGRSGRLLNGRVYEEMPQTPFDSDAHPLVQLSLPM